MARYVYTCEDRDSGEVLVYLESTPEEDALDEVNAGVLVGFTGNGYLSFWKRCKEAALSLTGHGLRRSVITDTYTGEEKVW